jgi:LmbE family N-acetylglucosaminyl deacetylase
MDDAVYSCGGQIALARASGARVLVVTLFGNGARDERGRGLFGDMSRRKREELAAMEQLDADYVWLNFPDMLCRRAGPRELLSYVIPFMRPSADDLLAQMHAAIYALCARLLAPNGRVYFPLGVGFHPDHRRAFEVGRLLQSEPNWPVAFYEDVPYAQVRALREDRLRHLGWGGPSALFRDTRDIHAFVFPRSKRWHRPVSWSSIFVHLVMGRLLFRLVGTPDPIAGNLTLLERDISSVVAKKIVAIRAYASQTDFFFPRGDAIYDVLTRSCGHFVERYWTVSPDASAVVCPPSDRLLELEYRKIARVLGPLYVELPSA